MEATFHDSGKLAFDARDVVAVEATEWNADAYDWRAVYVLRGDVRVGAGHDHYEAAVANLKKMQAAARKRRR